jgi:hypothetical protein
MLVEILVPATRFWDTCTGRQHMDCTIAPFRETELQARGQDEFPDEVDASDDAHPDADTRVALRRGAGR